MVQTTVDATPDDSFIRRAETREKLRSLTDEELDTLEIDIGSEKDHRAAIAAKQGESLAAEVERIRREVAESDRERRIRKMEEAERQQRGRCESVLRRIRDGLLPNSCRCATCISGLLAQEPERMCSRGYREFRGVWGYNDWT